MSQPVPYKNILFNRLFDLKEVLETDDYADFGFFREVFLPYPFEIREKAKRFPPCPLNRKASKNDFFEYLTSNKPKKTIDLMIN